MRPMVLYVPALALVFVTASHAINARYGKQLERSGCTQVTELKGCDIHKTKAENGKVADAAQVGSTSTPAATKSGSSVGSGSPYTGNWIATGTEGATVAKIRIDAKEKVWVNGKVVKVKRSDGALDFKDKFNTYTIQGDRRLKGEDTWYDSDAQSRGPIKSE